MATIVDFTTLKSNLEGTLNRSDFSAYEDMLVQMGERWIYRNVRCRSMETALAVTISASVAGAAVVPSDYLELKSAYVNSSGYRVPLQRKNVEFIYGNYPLRSSDDVPKFLAREGTSFIFGPYPDSAYTVQGIYYKKYASIVTASGATTNALIQDHPDLWLFAALCEAEPFLENEERLPLWKSKRDAIANDINQEEQASSWSGSNLSMSPA